MHLTYYAIDRVPEVRPKCEGLKQVIAAMRAAFPDIQWKIEGMVGEEDKVFSRFTWRGTHRGDFGRHGLALSEIGISPEQHIGLRGSNQVPSWASIRIPRRSLCFEVSTPNARAADINVGYRAAG